MADNCSICLNSLAQGALAVQDGCRHIHHEECIRGWLATRSPRTWSCPICRKRIRSIQTIPNFNLPVPRLSEQGHGNVRQPVHREEPQEGARNENNGNMGQEGARNENNGNMGQEGARNENNGNMGQEGARNENDGNVGQEEPEVVILDPPSPPSVPRPSTVSERNQGDSERVVTSARNRPASSVRRPIEYINPTYGSQSIAVPVQGHHPQVPSSSSLVVLQPVPFPGTSTGAQFTGRAGISILHPRLSSQASGSQHGVAPSHFNRFSVAPVSATLPQNPVNDVRFVCPTCHLGFRVRNSLYRHTRRVHQGRLDCPAPNCTRTFTERSRLRHHLNNDHLE